VAVIPTTGIFGGRFDPPHLGHLALARAAREQLRLERLHVTVIADAAHKRSEAAAEHRLEMARLTFAELDAVVELERHRYTVDALEAGRYEDPIFLIGADELAAFSTWKRPQRVLELARLGVAARPGHAPPVDDSDRIEVFELEPHDVSSSDIRARLRRGEPIDGLVVPAVADYIAAHGLYVRGSRLC
jgi:nicotinate-nucleotide adenylyltransferase